ncbi:MAG: adenylyl-sulfate kinase [Trichormus sp. ATA11-4-KO1]|jgi:adenylyl-sulfate kinase|nr:adenylyl-sulfate kinase [Trichormus sp. ATA11-4-KO1]
MENQVTKPNQTLVSTGFTCWLTGLSGAGKSTIATELSKALNNLSVSCEVLDGDVIRKHLSSDLGFSPKDRETNVLRVGYLCSLLNKHSINTIVALISPFNATRNQLRQSLGKFIEIYVDCPLEECIKRDPKGLYQRAISGEIPEFTGISSPYEAPVSPDIVLKTYEEDVNQSVEKILKYLHHLKLIDIN